MEILILILILIFAFIAETIDSSLGMGYGTFLSPLLILMGIHPLIAIPALLLTQSTGGAIASFYHNKYQNVCLSKGSKDLKIALLIIILGIMATIFAVIVGVNINPLYVKIYINLLVLIMGIIILMNKISKFSWKKIWIIGLISAFNKGISGGGFGPIVSGGQVLVGQECKSAVGITTFSEVLVCLAAFITYVLTGNLTISVFSVSLIIVLFLGSSFAAMVGPIITKKIEASKLKKCLGILLIIEAICGLIKIVF